MSVEWEHATPGSECRYLDIQTNQIVTGLRRCACGGEPTYRHGKEVIWRGLVGDVDHINEVKCGFCGKAISERNGSVPQLLWNWNESTQVKP